MKNWVIQLNVKAYEIFEESKINTIDRKQRNIFKYPCDK